MIDLEQSQPENRNMCKLSNQIGLNFINLKSFKGIVYKKELFTEITLEKKAE